MNRLRYIVVITLLLLASSCLQSDVDDVVISQSNDTVKIIGRVMPFSSRYVSTRVDYKLDAEKEIVSMCLAVFGSDRRCKDLRYSDGSNASFVIEKQYLKNGDQLYIFANIPDPTEGNNAWAVGDTVDKFVATQCEVNGIVEIPTFMGHNGQVLQGLPMIGKYDIVDKNNLPVLIPIPLESIYSKIYLEISVDPDQKIEGYDYASFYLEGFEVHNVADSVDFVGGTENSTTDNVGVLSTIFDGSHMLEPDKVFAQGGTSKKASLYFYLPERYLKSDYTINTYPYPFGSYADLDDDEKRRLPQRYKPLLAEGKGATFVRFFGEYIDHKGDNFNVSYDIYIGNNNCDNFDVVRNTQYNNIITIKGLAAYNDVSHDPNSIAIDHRVDVERVEPIITNMMRETLLDSHFEVRPLRIRKNPDYTGSVENSTVTVEVTLNDQSDADWVGIELSFGGQAESSTKYLVESELPTNRKNAAGKRRYFTSGLMDELGTTITNIPITDTGECIWIYVDETNPAYAGDAVRSATIKITYYANGVQSGEPIEYIINQRELFKVEKNGNEYLIEYHEEYLHNFDAEDSFGLTHYEGMPWGLEEVPLSDSTPAILVGKGGVDSFSNSIKNSLKSSSAAPYYDFYLTRDVREDIWTFTGSNNDTYAALVHDYNGYNFSKDIVAETNESPVDARHQIAALTLSQEPKSAVEYCYNKNKRNEHGIVEDEDLVWYLPAIDEIEEIVKSQYGDGSYSYVRFDDFRAKYYWSSQPAYKYNYIDISRTYLFTAGSRYGIYMTDNEDRARATKIEFIGGDPQDDNNYKVQESSLKNEFGDEDDTTTGDIVMNATFMAHGLFYATANGSSGEVDESSIEISSFEGLYNDNASTTFERANQSCPGSTFGRDKWHHKVIAPEYWDGAKSRAEYARVRCVRKKP